MHVQGKDRVEIRDRQVRFPLMVKGMNACDYVLDFIVRYADGRKEFVEVKGYWTPEAKLKKKLFEATVMRDYPDINTRYGQDPRQIITRNV